MSIHKLAIPVAALSMAVFIPRAGAAGEVTLSLARVRSGEVSYGESDDCRSIAISSTVGWREAWEYGAYSTFRVASVRVSVYDTCTPGKTRTVELDYKNTQDPPMITARLDGPAVVIEEEASAYTCELLPEGEYNCSEGTVPVVLRVDWQARGRIVHQTSVTRTPFTDGTMEISTNHLASRAATVFISGTIGEIIVDAQEERALKAGEQLRVQVQRR